MALIPNETMVSELRYINDQIKTVLHSIFALNGKFDPADMSEEEIGHYLRINHAEYHIMKARDFIENSICAELYDYPKPD